MKHHFTPRKNLTYYPRFAWIPRITIDGIVWLETYEHMWHEGWHPFFEYRRFIR